jgi:hypothetical protein
MSEYDRIFKKKEHDEEEKETSNPHSVTPAQLGLNSYLVEHADEEVSDG